MESYSAPSRYWFSYLLEETVSTMAVDPHSVVKRLYIFNLFFIPSENPVLLKLEQAHLPVFLLHALFSL